MPRLLHALRRALVAPLLLVACNKGDESGAMHSTADVTTASPPSAPRAAAAIPRAGRPGSRTEASEEAIGRGFGTSSGGAGTGGDAAEQPAPPAEQATTPTMLIRTGHATLEVDSLEVAIARVQAISQRLGGFVAGTSIQSGEGERRSATLELKIPNARFDAATDGLAAIGRVEGLNVSSEDVGEEFVDVTARVENARRLETRLIELLARRTGKLEEVLQVERELARVREEIERYEGRLRYLRSRVSLSTLTVTVHEPRPIIDPRPGPSPIGEAFRQAWRNFVGFLAGFISSLGWLVPLLVLVGALVWAWRRWMPSAPVPPFGPPRPRDGRDVPPPAAGA